MSEESLPTGWVKAPIASLISADGIFTDGDWVESKDQDPNGDVRLIQLADIGDGAFHNKSSRFLTRKKAGELRCTFLKSGDLLIARMPDPLGRACVFPLEGAEKFVTVVDVCVIRTSPDVASSDFLQWAINFLGTRKQIEDLQTGTTRKRISRKNLATVTIPLPPLAEQKRIVLKIEELFSELDAGEESLRRARRQLGVYRQSLLKQAFEGKLTAPWRAQYPDLLESPDQLLTRIQEDRETLYQQQLEDWDEAIKGWEARGKEGKRPKKPKAPSTVERIPPTRLRQLPDLPEGWIWQTIENLVGQGRACSYGVLKPGPHVESGVPLVRVGDIQNGRVSTADMKRVAPEIVQQYRRTELRGGEFLISLVGAIGRTAVVPPELRGANTARAVGVVPLSAAINADFVEICFRSPVKLREMVSQANEVARKTLNLEDVRNATVPLCSLSEQQEIVRLLDEQFEVIEQNEREIDAALKRSEALRQSILKKAFTGQLVPQDPSDEPASELLARIRAEREKPPGKAKKKRSDRSVRSDEAD